jgi:hypothetical protein
MSEAILATVLGGAVTLFATCRKLAAPCLTSAPKPSRQALVPTMKMFSMRRDCHRLHHLGGFPRLNAKLDDLSAWLLRSPFQRFSENRGYVKLNNLRHSHLPRACDPL